MNPLDKFAVGVTASLNHAVNHAVGRAILADLDPFSILKDNNNLGSKSATSDAFYLLDLGGLFYFLKKNALIVGTIVVVALLVTMLFVNKAEALADKKKDIEHKLVILFLICSSVTIFGWMKKLFDTFLL